LSSETPNLQQAVANAVEVYNRSDVATDAATTGSVIGAGVFRSALPIVPVIVRNPFTGAEMQTCALLDSGSTNSFCSADVDDKLMLEGPVETLRLTTIETEDIATITKRVSLQLCSLDGQNVVELPCV
jgi:hypothetical protein